MQRRYALHALFSKAGLIALDTSRKGHATLIHRKFKGCEMATEIISYGFTPGPPTEKDLEPKPTPVAQPMQQDFREAIILILAIAIALFAATQFLRALRQLPAV
jgi:hypothetical protein